MHSRGCVALTEETCVHAAAFRNIWSALGPFILFVVMAIEILRIPHLAQAEKAVFVVYSVGAMGSFGTSTVYHWFGCMSRRANINLVRMDIAAIALLIGAFLDWQWHSLLSSSPSLSVWILAYNS